jgi:signal peptidase I
LPAGTHYIKRLVGMPGERISIDPPWLKVNGEKVMEPESIARIARQEDGYAGYQLVHFRALTTSRYALRKPSDFVPVEAHRYFVLGDNTRNSKDGRYWGTVPESNMVGPAWVVYWPFSSRWGVIP